MRLSVVIPHLNQPEMLKRCLASLLAGVRQPDEIIVVDNGSHEMPVGICAAHSGLRLLREPVPGPGPARNTGIAASTGDVLAFIDSDCVASPEWLAEAERAMSDPLATILGGDVRIAWADSARLTAIEAYESIFAYRMDRYIAREGFTGTGNLVVRRPVLDKVGPFAGIGIAEDIDWGKRATAMGYRIRYVAAMKVFHPARPDMTSLKVKWNRHTAHFFEETAQGWAGQARWLARTAAMALSPLGEIPRIIATDRVAGLRNRLLAFVVLARIRAYRTRIMLWLAFGGDPARLSGQWNRASSPAGRS
jgi:glycosyltransferase involved in cell wall biosynthesis